MQNIFFFVVVGYAAFTVWYVAAFAWSIGDAGAIVLHRLHVALSLVLASFLVLYAFRVTEWRNARWPTLIAFLVSALLSAWVIYISFLLELEVAPRLRWCKGTREAWDAFMAFATRYPWLTTKACVASFVASLFTAAPLVVLFIFWFRKRARSGTRQFLRWGFLLLVQAIILSLLSFGGYEVVRLLGSRLTFELVRKEFESYPLDRALEIASQRQEGVRSNTYSALPDSGLAIPTGPLGSYVQVAGNNVQFGISFSHGWHSGGMFICHDPELVRIYRTHQNEATYCLRDFGDGWCDVKAGLSGLKWPWREQGF